jgi:hypothetical protein
VVFVLAAHVLTISENKDESGNNSDMTTASTSIATAAP